jgi:hypothetical protein
MLAPGGRQGIDIAGEPLFRKRGHGQTALLEKLLGCECPDIEFCGRAIEKNAATRPRRVRRRSRTALG